MNRLTKQILSFSLVVAAVAASASRPAAAASCVNGSNDYQTTGDRLYQNSWCSPTFINFFVDNYDMHEPNWNQGFGWDQACNIDLAFGRTMGALFALHYSSPNPSLSSGDLSGNILRWGGQYARNTIDELDAACGDGSAFAETWSGLQDNRTALYLPFFYSLSIPERAATTLHEARHADGYPHQGSCARGASCDPSWGYAGANNYQVAWLSWYIAEGVNTTSYLKERARDRGNAILAGGFGTDPGWRINASRDIPLSGDINGDGISDIIIFRSADGTWHARSGANTSQTLLAGLQFGQNGDIPIVANFNNSGGADLGIYRPSDGSWHAITMAGTLIFGGKMFGGLTDIPVPGNFDSDGKLELTIFRPSNGTWHAKRYDNDALVMDGVAFGQSTDVPLVADFNHDGQSDLTLYRTVEGKWHSRTVSGTILVNGLAYGENGDTPMVGDFDGNGWRDDLGIYRPKDGTWHARTLNAQIFGGLNFGGLSDIPFVGRFNADNVADLGIFRPADGTWHVISRPATLLVNGLQFGAAF